MQNICYFSQKKFRHFFFTFCNISFTWKSHVTQICSVWLGVYVTITWSGGKRPPGRARPRERGRPSGRAPRPSPAPRRRWRRLAGTSARWWRSWRWCWRCSRPRSLRAPRSSRRWRACCRRGCRRSRGNCGTRERRRFITKVFKVAKRSARVTYLAAVVEIRKRQTGAK